MHVFPIILATWLISPAQHQLFTEANMTVISHDFIQIHRHSIIDIRPLSEAKVCVLSSKNALYALIHTQQMAHINGKKIYCVGDSISRILATYEIPVSRTFVNAKEMAHFLVSHKTQSVAYLCGNKSRDELPNILHAHHITLYKIPCYWTQLNPIHIPQTPDGILFLSPSAVESYLMENTISHHQQIICIGETTKKSLGTIPNHITTPSIQRIDSVIETAIHIFKQPYQKYEARI